MTTIDKALPLGAETIDLNKFSRAGSKTPENVAAIKKLSEEFEAIFLEIVLKSMRETIHKTEMTDGGNGEQIFQSMLDSEYSKSLAVQRSSGIAASIEENLLRMMPEDPRTTPNQKAAGRIEYQKAAKGQGVETR